MRLPDDLRQWLLRSAKGLSGDAGKLNIFIDEGSLRAGRGESLSFLYSYELTVIVEDWAHDTADLFVPLMVWIAKNAPDLLDEGKIGFQSEILDKDKCDIEIKLNLSEPVIVQNIDGGGWRVEYPERPAFPPQFEGAPNARLSQLWLNNISDHFMAQPEAEDPDGG